jgi:hypothetical protein
MYVDVNRVESLIRKSEDAVRRSLELIEQTTQLIAAGRSLVGEKYCLGGSIPYPSHPPDPE